MTYPVRFTFARAGTAELHIPVDNPDALPPRAEQTLVYPPPQVGIYPGTPPARDDPAASGGGGASRSLVVPETHVASSPPASTGVLGGRRGVRGWQRGTQVHRGAGGAVGVGGAVFDVHVGD